MSSSSSASEVRTRFAPSPTGRLHAGGARIALLNFLLARAAGGAFLLRWEDTDARRADARFEAAIRRDLAWLGISWDAETRQSEARAHHERALHALAARGLAYRCFCPEEALARERARARAAGRPPRYSGCCRGLAPEEAARRARGAPCVWRLAARAETGEIVVRDLLRGEVRFARRDLDDPVLVRADGGFTFLLPNAVDDAREGVTHVVRGDDHLTNAAYQVLMLEALGLPVPRHAHVGLLVDAKGRKLSKRSGDADIGALREAGWEPEAVAVLLARLGHPNLPDDALDLDALARAFRPERLSTAPARWDPAQLAALNVRVLRALPPEALAARIRPWLPPAARARARAIADLVRENLARAADVRKYPRIWDETAPASEDARGVLCENPWVFEHLPENGEDFQAYRKRLERATGRRGRALMPALRAAMLGRTDGPPLAALFAFWGAEGARARMIASKKELAACPG